MGARTARAVGRREDALAAGRPSSIIASDRSARNSPESAARSSAWPFPAEGSNGPNLLNQTGDKLEDQSKEKKLLIFKIRKR